MFNYNMLYLQQITATKYRYAAKNYRLERKRIEVLETSGIGDFLPRGKTIRLVEMEGGFQDVKRFCRNS